MVTEETLILMTGCFWGAEYALREYPVQTEVGYAGGSSPDAPTYYNLDRSGHSECVRVRFDPAAITLDALLSVLGAKSARDPSPPTHPRYRRAVLCTSEGQAERVRQCLAQIGVELSVEVNSVFHRAEDYHQRYYERKLAD